MTNTEANIGIGIALALPFGYAAAFQWAVFESRALAMITVALYAILVGAVVIA